MKATLRANGIAVAREATAELCARLGLPTIAEARPGADLLERARRGLPFPRPGTLLRAADGWVHPGPPTVWDTLSAMVVSLGAMPAVPARSDDFYQFPDISGLSAEAIDEEAGEWRLPAVAVRSGSTGADHALPNLPATDARGATVVVLGTAWAVPLTGLALARLGARVVRVENPRREDPFPLRDALAHGQTRVALDVDTAPDRDAFVAQLSAADLLVDGNTPRVLANIGLDDALLLALNPRLSVVRVGAFAAEDRPGYGLAAECRGGWASRAGRPRPRLGRTSVADPVAGLIAAAVGVGALAHPGSRTRVSLEAAVGHLLAVEARRG